MPSAKDIRLLIVDDDNALLTALAELFRLYQFQVETAADGRLALDEMSKGRYDVILTDSRMPNISGFELLKIIKRDNSTSPKVLMNSGYVDNTVEELYSHGITGFFSKPFNSTVVKECIQQALLNPAERWARPNKQRALRYEATAEDFGQASTRHLLSRGNIGAFMAMSDLPRLNTWIDFTFKFTNQPACPMFAGEGVVKWIRDTDNKIGPKGIGVEFKYLEPNSLKSQMEWMTVASQVASIPRA